MSYNLTNNITELSEFINTLPALELGEAYIVRLITRAKYNKNIARDYDLRTIIIEHKSEIPIRIDQLSQESFENLTDSDLGLYITINPRSYYTCIKEMMLVFANILGSYKNENPISIVYRTLRRSPSRIIYHDIDFDSVDIPETINSVAELINIDSVSILPTKGGVHFIINLSKVDLVTYPDWKSNISKLAGYDQLMAVGDNMIPIPGCNQFGFTPIIQKT